MGYSGCRNLEELRTKAKFIRITAASVAESYPHSIKITEEPPNYQMPR
jgi:IMP dehydrogenase